MPTNLPISRLIKVNVNLAPAAAQAQNLSTLLVLTAEDIIDVVERLRTYTTLDAVASDFGTNSIAYACAVLWFEQAPQPSALKIGRWAKSATSAILRCGLLSAYQQAIAAWNAVTTPGFELDVNGQPLSFHPATFAAAANMPAIAGIIQTALAAQVAGTTCTWDANYNRFQIEVAGSTGVGSTISFLQAPTAVGYIGFAGQPANNDKFTLNGTDVIFVTVPATGKVTIGGDLPTTIANAAAFISASVDAQLVKFIPYAGAAVLGLKAATAGVGGDALTLAKTGANLSVSAATMSGGTATDISGMMAGLSTSSGAYFANGIDAETATAAATLFDSQFGQTWYALTMPQAVDADQLNVAAYVEGSNNKHLLGVSTQEAGVLSSISTTDIAYELKALGYNRSMVQYSSSNAYAVCSLFGRALTVNYNGNSTVINLMYKQEPGIVAESLTETQIDALEGKNCNVFVAYNNNTAIIEPGKMSSGNYIDEMTGTDWLALTIQTAEYNLLYTSTTKIPQTDAGMHLLAVTAEAVLAQGVANGLLAPGVWNSGGFGSLNQGDYLAKGFYVYAPPVALQLQADREARKSVPIQIAAKLAGAVDTVDITINVNR